MAHHLTQTARSPHTSRFHTKSWSAEFTCPTCGRRARYNLNFLGRRVPFCDSGERFLLLPWAMENGKRVLDLDTVRGDLRVTELLPRLKTLNLRADLRGQS